jgi:hypothetical protein
MPRHLISDAHEWINEILTVPNYRFSEPTAKGTGLAELAGKEDPLELDSRQRLINGLRSIA